MSGTSDRRRHGTSRRAGARSPAPRTCPPSTPVAPRSAAASQRSAATGDHGARGSSLRSRPRRVALESRLVVELASQLSTSAIRPRQYAGSAIAATMRAVPSMSPDPSTWTSAASGSSCASNQSAARRWSAATSSGSFSASSRASRSRNSGWQRYASPRRSSGATSSVQPVERGEHASGVRALRARHRRAGRSAPRGPTSGGGTSADRASAAPGTRNESTRPGTDRRRRQPRARRRGRRLRAHSGGCLRPIPRTDRARSLASSSGSPASSPRRAPRPRAGSAPDLRPAAPAAFHSPEASRSATRASPDPPAPASIRAGRARAVSRALSSSYGSGGDERCRRRGRCPAIELSRDVRRASSAVHSLCLRAEGAASGLIRSSAAAIAPSRSVGSSSPSSSDSQANCRRSRSAHCAVSVVFPYPAGAVRVMRGADAARRRFTSGVLDTTHGGGGGTRTVASTTFDGAARVRPELERGMPSSMRGRWNAHQSGRTTLYGALAPMPGVAFPAAEGR